MNIVELLDINRKNYYILKITHKKRENNIKLK